MRSPKRIRELLNKTSTAEFSYSRDDQAFTVGSRTVDIESAVADPGKLSAQHGDTLSGEDPLLVVTGWWRVAYPGMYDWLHKSFDSSVSEETVMVMIDAFSKARPDIQRSDLQHDRGGMFGFSAEIGRSDHPHISLNVMGHCACLGAKVDGMFGQEIWSSKFASYETHNIDTPEQAVSILAGLGHLAQRAAKG